MKLADSIEETCNTREPFKTRKHLKQEKPGTNPGFSFIY